MLRSLIAVVLAATVGLATLLLIRPVAGRKVAILPVMATVPDFELVERSGAAFRKHDLMGHVCVVDFFFTSCAGTCPIMSRQMQQLQDRALAGLDVRLVSFTVDPQNDTPAVLRGYARGFAAQEGRWFFVTGEKAALHELAQKGFKLPVFEDPGADGPFTHSQKFVLIDRRARLRGYFDGTEPDEMPKLRTAVEQLLAE